MAISFNTSFWLAETTGGAGTTTDSVSGPGSLTDGVVLALLEGDTTSDLITAVTYGGVSMSLLVKDKGSSDRWGYIFGLLAPSTGTQDLVCTRSGTTYIGRQVAFYEGVKQSGLPDAFNANSRAGTGTLDTSVTTVADNCWLVGYGKSASGNPSAGTATTQRESASGFGVYDSNGAKTPAGSYALQISVNTAGGLLVVSLAPETGGGGLSIPIVHYHRQQQRKG